MCYRSSNPNMKTPRVLLISLLGLTAGLSVRGAADRPPERVDIVFLEPEKFTDVRDGYMGTEKGRDATLAQIGDYIRARASVLVPEGMKLAITITDVDLAGDFEPWHGSRWDDVRIVKDIYPPRIVLVFRLTDADGKVVKEGKRDLRDMAFMMKLSIDRNDPLRHEKALLDDWLSADFRPVKAK